MKTFPPPTELPVGCLSFLSDKKCFHNDFLLNGWYSGRRNAVVGHLFFELSLWMTSFPLSHPVRCKKKEDISSLCFMDITIHFNNQVVK